MSSSRGPAMSVERLPTTSSMRRCVPSPGPWRNDDIYFFLIDSEEPDRGYLLFHGEVMRNEGNDTWDSVSMDGVYLGRELIRNAGRRFSRWRHDRPFVEGDEEEGSLKIAWSEPIHIAGDAFILGSGIYPEEAETVPAVPLAGLAILTMLLLLAQALASHLFGFYAAA